MTSTARLPSLKRRGREMSHLFVCKDKEHSIRAHPPPASSSAPPEPHCTALDHCCRPQISTLGRQSMGCTETTDQLPSPMKTPSLYPSNICSLFISHPRSCSRARHKPDNQEQWPPSAHTQPTRASPWAIHMAYLGCSGSSVSREAESCPGHPHPKL